MEPQKINLAEFPSEEVSPLLGADIPAKFFAVLLAALKKCHPRKSCKDEKPEEMPDRIDAIARAVAARLFAHGKLPRTDYFQPKVQDINIALAASGSDLRLVEGAPPNGYYFLIRVT